MSVSMKYLGQVYRPTVISGQRHSLHIHCAAKTEDEFLRVEASGGPECVIRAKKKGK